MRSIGIKDVRKEWKTRRWYTDGSSKKSKANVLISISLCVSFGSLSSFYFWCY